MQSFHQPQDAIVISMLTSETSPREAKGAALSLLLIGVGYGDTAGKKDMGKSGAWK